MTRTAGPPRQETTPGVTTSRFHFDDDYREEAQLADGSRVQLRVVAPEDRELLRHGFGRLSSETRFLRFMGRKPALSEEELKALTDLDGMDQLAIGAVRLDPEAGPSEGLGVARFVRSPDEPDVAEAAVTVVDAAQGRGLGSILLRRLAAAARERGVRRFGGEILVCNEPMRRLLADHAAATITEADDEVLRMLVELPSYSELMSDSLDRGDLLERLLAQAAGGDLRMRLGHVLLKRG